MRERLSRSDTGVSLYFWRKSSSEQSVRISIVPFSIFWSTLRLCALAGAVHLFQYSVRSNMTKAERDEWIFFLVYQVGSLHHHLGFSVRLIGVHQMIPCDIQDFLSSARVSSVSFFSIVTLQSPGNIWNAVKNSYHFPICLTILLVYLR